MSIGSLHELVVQCANPIALARFWQALLGGEVDVEDDDRVLLDGDDDGFYVRFQRVSDRPAAGRIHFDIAVDDLVLAVDEAELLGARKIGGPVDGDDGPYQVMADPEGNQFCLLGDE